MTDVVYSTMSSSHQLSDGLPTDETSSDLNAKQARKVQWLVRRGSDSVHGLDESAQDVRPCHAQSLSGHWNVLTFGACVRKEAIINLILPSLRPLNR